MVVAAFRCFENPLMQGEQCLHATFLERHRGEQFVAGIALGILPGKGEDDAFGFDDLAIDARSPVLGALWRAHATAVLAADADIHVAMDRGEALRAPPARDVLWL